MKTTAITILLLFTAFTSAENMKIRKESLERIEFLKKSLNITNEIKNISNIQMDKNIFSNITTNNINNLCKQLNLDQVKIYTSDNMINVQDQYGVYLYSIDAVAFPNSEFAINNILLNATSSSMPMSMVINNISLIEDGPGDFCLGFINRKSQSNTNIYRRVYFSYGNAYFKIRSGKDDIDALAVAREIDKLVRETAKQGQENQSTK